ncbi:hypothetical protein CO701_03285 [Citrobacter werkmanii]|uniref:hypothetical protein n=1 Tax=Citrobacter sp. wls711 TaxID=2576425 RepID=UPI000BBD369C|nr:MULTISPECIES: hypothetical protein [Citrobacter]ATF48237.1 hypothetical protein CO701_03285 [Citrobacter werkmanii]TKU66178.1 hypothetical protein FDW98_01165 [Citrobacter sp. wls711]
MRNKSLAYPLWGLLGLLLLASATLLTARPSDAADTDTTVDCYRGVMGDCRSSTKNEREIFFTASFIEPACEVTVPSQITLPDATISDFLTADSPLNLQPSDSGGSSNLYTEFGVTLQECAIDSLVWPKLHLVFTDLGTTTGTTGIFAADEPPRDDVGFAIFSTDGETVDNVLITTPEFENLGSNAEGTTYHFKARMQVHPNATSITPGPVVGSVSVVVDYE